MRSSPRSPGPGHRTGRLSTAIPLAVLLAACGAGAGEDPPDPGTPLEHAARTGELIGTVAWSVVREIRYEGRPEKEVWQETYGDFVSTAPTADGGMLFDDAFELGPRDSNIPEYANASDGLPAVLLPYPSGAAGFFYELTYLEPTTGAIYQGDNYEGLYPAIELWGFRGPLLPPENARVTRSDVEAIPDMAGAIDEAVIETMAALCAAETFASECRSWVR